MELKRYDSQTGLLDGSVAPSGFERSKINIPARRNIAVAGMLLLAIAIFISLLLSYQTIFMAYSIFTIFVFMCYLVLWVDGAWEDKEPASIKEWPSVSLIIPSYNSAHTIFKCVQACQKLKYPGKLDITVVDDGSTDGSCEKLHAINGIRTIHKEKNEGKAAAMNTGILASKGEIVGCVDSDTYPKEDALLHAVKYFEADKKVGSVVLFINTTPPKTFIQAVQEIEYWISFGFFFKTVAAIDGLYVTPGPMALYRKKMFEELGGFDEKNLTEDMEIALRMQRHGWKIKACHTSVVFTEVPASIKPLYRQRLRWFRGGIMNMLKYIDMFLNPTHGNFGLFILPVTLGSGFFAALFILWTLLNYVRAGINYAAPWVSNFSILAASGISVPFDPFLLDSAMIFGLISLVIWGYFVHKSFSISGHKPQARHILPLLGILYIYPLFIGFTYLSAYVHEFSGKRYKW